MFDIKEPVSECLWNPMLCTSVSLTDSGQTRVWLAFKILCFYGLRILRLGAFKVKGLKGPRFRKPWNGIRFRLGAKETTTSIENPVGLRAKKMANKGFHRGSQWGLEQKKHKKNVNTCKYTNCKQRLKHLKQGVSVGQAAKKNSNKGLNKGSLWGLEPRNRKQRLKQRVSMLLGAKKR